MRCIVSTICGALLLPFVLMGNSTPVRASTCRVPDELARFALPLLSLRKAVATQRVISVVALGSSSTAGSGASTPNASYPARLDAELDWRFPGKDFVVANFGVGGQLASEMLERIANEIIPMSPRPSLVLWQTGVNDVVQGIDLEAYKETLGEGIRRLKTAGIDVVLVNMQYYPRSERVAGYNEFLLAMHAVARAENVPVFRRFSIMKHLVKSGQYTTDQLLAPDNFHLNDLSYGCLARLMAEALTDVVTEGRRTHVRGPTITD